MHLLLLGLRGPAVTLELCFLPFLAVMTILVVAGHVYFYRRPVGGDGRGLFASVMVPDSA
jgi:hypothetical protein